MDGAEEMLKVIVIAALTAALAAGTPTAGAKPCQGVYNQSGCQPAPWPGQMQDTWNIPGSYGGWVNTPIACNPRTTKCEMWAQP